MVVAVEGEQALLDNAVTAIVADHDIERQLVMRGGPERLDRIHRAAVAGEAHDRTIRISEADADGGRQAPTDAAGSKRMIAVAVAMRAQREELAARREALVDQDRVVGHRL